MRKINRVVIYLLGIVLVALGGIIAIKSNLGATPVNSLPLAISSVSILELGTVSTILFIIYVGIQIILLRKEFKAIQLLQIVFAVLFGRLMSYFNMMININVENIFLRITVCLLSFFITSVGVMFTITADIVPIAPDGLAQAIAKKKNIDFGKAKLYFDIVIVVLSVAVLLVGGKGLEGLGISTVLSALCVGRIVSLLNKHFKEKLESFIFYKEDTNNVMTDY